MRFGVDRPVPVAEMSGLCSFCPGGLKVGETEQIGEQPFPLLIDAGDSQNVADGVLVFHLSEKKMLEGVAAIEKKLVVATGNSERAKKRKIFRGLLQAVVDFFIEKRCNMWITFGQPFPGK